MNAKELSLVPDLVLPPKFKVPEFEKYNGTNCPEAHITMFYRKMTGHVNNDQLLIHCFQDSLTGTAAKWYNQLSRTQVKSWKDLAQAFVKHYGHVKDIAPDRITLQNMGKKLNESFRQYAQKWREVVTQVQPPLLEKETTIFFINNLKAPFINHMLGSATKSFADIVISGEMVKNAIRCGKIEVGESTKRSAPKKRENEVGNVSGGYAKPITVNEPRAVAMGQQASPRQEPNTKQNAEKLQFTLILMTYRELYKSLFDAHIVFLVYLKPLQRLYPKWYDASTQCEYHTGIMWHSIENCFSFKKLVERLIKMGIVKFDDAPGVGNSLPNHIDNWVNAIIENAEKRIKLNVAEVRTSLREVLRRMVEKRALVQGLINDKELEFFEFTKGEDVCTIGRESVKKGAEVNQSDSKRVPWNYNCNVTYSGKESLIGMPNTKVEPEKGKSLMIEQGGKRSKPLVNEPVIENEAKDFLKFLKHSEYSVVEQLHKQPTRISVLALLLNSEIHRNTLMKVLNETYVADDISVNKLDRLVGNISVDNFISFSDDEIPPGGMGSTKALHITTRCKGYMLSGVLIDNGSALNVLPLSTLNRLHIDSSHIKTCQNIVRALDGIGRKVMGRIKIPLLIGPNTYEVDFLVMDIRPSYNGLLGRPWIYSAGAVPSSLYQKLKLVTEGRLITINAEDFIAFITSDEPYIENDFETIECSFRSLEFSPNIDVMSNTAMDPKLPCERDMCLEVSQDFTDDGDCSLSPDLLRMVEWEEKLILPHKEIIENVILEEGKEMKIDTCINEETMQDLIKLLLEFKDVFAWSYQDMPRLSADIAVHHVKKQFDAGFLQVVNYSEWVANVVPVPKKDGKVWMCIDYRDLNKASPKDNFSLPHIDTLVDNTAGYSLFSFMNGFSGYNQIKMNPEDMEKPHS
ncbi:Integrase, catalytic core [Gossypium australe]|uniref:Integrase, catalytic core n=1 Tax=Gossypium australe TaxID=47621 RepID=A0A5B6UZJ8_9ROSI|nr:Integrase, catalytic core [Gossypium australe]